MMPSLLALDAGGRPRLIMRRTTNFNTPAFGFNAVPFDQVDLTDPRCFGLGASNSEITVKRTGFYYCTFSGEINNADFAGLIIIAGGVAIAAQYLNSLPGLGNKAFSIDCLARIVAGALVYFISNSFSGGSMPVNLGTPRATIIRVG